MKKLYFFIYLWILFFTGCNVAPFIVSPIVTGVTMWRDGEGHKYYNEEAYTIYRATKTSLKELKHSIAKDETTKDGGFYILAGEGDKFKIVIRQVKPHITEVKIRVNIMGNKPYAELVYRQIDSNTNTISFDDQGKPTKRKLKRHMSQ